MKNMASGAYCKEKRAGNEEMGEDGLGKVV